MSRGQLRLAMSKDELLAQLDQQIAALISGKPGTKLVSPERFEALTVGGLNIEGVSLDGSVKLCVGGQVKATR